MLFVLLELFLCNSLLLDKIKEAYVKMLPTTQHKNWIQTGFECLHFYLPKNKLNNEQQDKSNALQ